MTCRPPHVIRACFGCLLAVAVLLTGATAKEVPAPVTLDKDGRLAYATTAEGDRAPDFSTAGYRGGGVPLPHVPGRVRVLPGSGTDDGPRIQAALDHVGSLAPDPRGLRGAVELAPGRFRIEGQLRITASGVVLRGAGPGDGGTTLVAAGSDRRTLIEVAGRDTPRTVGGPRAIAGRVPVGGNRLPVADTTGLVPGLRVRIERPSPAEWLRRLGMDTAPARQPYAWKPGTVNLRWEREIAAVDGGKVILDAPLTTALEPDLGGGSLQVYEAIGYITDCGVENLRCESAYDAANLQDENHAWNAIDLHAVRDAWVTDVTARHFAGSAVQVGAKASRVTVQDCAHEAPVSERAGYRRLAFHVRGQQVLVLRCRSEETGAAFTVGHGTAGPVAFLECEGGGGEGFSGSIGAWASGLLFDAVNLDGGRLRLDNLETWNQGVGWAAASSMVWGSSAAEIVARRPPGANNWVVASWAQYVGDADWSQTSSFARPASLYRAQLAERAGRGGLLALERRVYRLDGGLPPWTAAPEAAPSRERRLELRDGRLTLGGGPVTGRIAGGAWWLGRLEPGRAGEAGPALTRFAPGRAGTGLTDEIPALAEAMQARGEVAFRHHYGLWYDRRRIDHQMVRRPDADVWPPYFEQPFARTGQGAAWDGLSRYDLTRYNPWYFGRLRAFATEARRRGLILINEMYFQHNILESGAHWVDSPWRPVNNVNGTGFSEPPPFRGDTIRMAAEFYDVAHPVRRPLHRAYIRQCLENLADEPNVVHSLTEENSGPLEFTRFWLDVIAEWQAETGRNPLILLSAPKDVQDAILADPARAAVIDVIELRYWFRTDDGREFAPAGGTELAPRQHLRLWKGGRPSAAAIAAMVREYRERFPAKAVIADGHW
jgi:hypothetical protein